MIRKAKEKKEKVKLTKEEIECDNQYELLSGLGSVYGKDIRTTLGRDYVLASFNPDQMVYIEESFENSLMVAKLLSNLIDIKVRYEWNEDDFDWKRNDDSSYKKFELEDDDKKRIQSAVLQVTKLLRTRPDVLSVLNRNKAENFLAKVWGDVKEVDEKGNEITSHESEGIMGKIQERLNQDG